MAFDQVKESSMKNFDSITFVCLFILPMLFCAGCGPEKRSRNPELSTFHLESPQQLLAGIKALGPRYFINTNSYELLIEALENYQGEGIVINRPDGITIAANHAYLAMLGYTMTEIQSVTYQQLTPAKWHAMEEKLFQKVLKTGYSGFYQKEYIRKDGAVFPIRNHAWLLLDSEQKPYRLFGLVQDLSNIE